MTDWDIRIVITVGVVSAAAQAQKVTDYILSLSPGE